MSLLSSKQKYKFQTKIAKQIRSQSPKGGV